MDSSAGANPLGAFLGFWMLIQLVVVLGLLLGGLYALFCLHRSAANLDRLASAVEDLVARSTSFNSPGGSVNPVEYQGPSPPAPLQSTLNAPEASPFNSAPQTNLGTSGEVRPL